MMRTLWIGAYSEQCLQMALHGGDDYKGEACVVEAIDRVISLGSKLDTFDLVILDAGIGGVLENPGTERLLKLDVPVLVKCAPHQETIALQLLQKGAQDYIVEVSEQSYLGLAHKIRQIVGCSQAYDRVSQLDKRLQHEQHQYDDAIAALTNTAEMYANILQSISDAVFVTDDDGAFTFVCPNAATIFGYSQAEILAMGSIHALMGERLLATSALKDDGEITNLEKQVLDVEGNCHDLLINVKRVDIGRGTLLYTCRDISDRKRAENLLHQSERDYHLLLENLPTGMIVYGPNTEILTNNAKASELLELTAEEMQGKTTLDPHWSLLREDGSPLPFEEYPVNKVVNTLQPIENQIIGINRPGSGTQIWVLVNAYPLLKEDHSLERIIVAFVDITVQRQAQFELKASEQRYASLAQAAPVGIFRTDREGNCIYMNDRCSAIAGMDFDRAMGQGWKENLHPDDREALASEWRDAAQNNRPFSLEYRFLRDDQETIWVYGQAVAEVDPSGTITGYIGTITDITERYLTEERLKESEARYRLLFEEANDLVLLHPLGNLNQPKHCFTNVNNAACELLGYTREEFQQLTPLDLIPKAEMDEVPDELNILTTDGKLLFEKTLIAKDGRRIPVELHAHVSDWHGQPMVLSIARDVSERKAAQAELEDRERLFRTLFEQSAVGMGLTAPDGSLFRVNQRACDLLGYTKEELLGQRVVDLVHPDYRQEKLRNRQRLLDGEASSFQQDQLFLKKDGTPIWLNVCVNLVRNPDGQPEYLLKVFQDVNDLVQAEADLKASETLFRDTFEQAAVGICRVSPAGRFIRLNHRFCDLVGYDHDELLSLSFQDITHPDDLAADLAHVNQLLMGLNKTFSIEKRYIRKDGTVVWANLTVSLVRNEADEPGYFIAAVEDISNRKAVQERLSLALSSANQGIYDLNLKTDEAVVGREYALMLGYDPDTFSETVTSWRERVHPDDRATIAEAYRAYARGDVQQYHAEFRMLTGQGTWKWVLSVGKFVEWDADGNPTRLLGTHTDIDDRKRAETELQILNQTLEQRVLERTEALSAANDRLQTQAAELHQTNQLLKLVMDSIPQRIFWKDQNSVLLGCNRQFAEDMGLTVEAAIGRGNHDFSATPEEADFYDACDRQVMESGEANLHILETLHRADGSVIYLDTSKVPLRNEQGEVIGLLGCYEDITQRRLMEAQLQQQLQKERLLSSLMQQMRQTLDLQKTLNLMVGQVRQLLNIDRVLLYTLDTDHRGRLVAESVTPDRLSLDLESIITIRPDCYRQYLSGRVSAVADVEQDALSDCVMGSVDPTSEVAAKVLAPIVDHDANRVWGLLVGEQCEHPREWEAWEIQLLEQLSNHLAIAVRQIRLYDQLQIELRQRKQVEQSLRASEAKLQLVTDSVNGCIAYVDAEQRYQFINQTYEEWFGWKKTDILGRTVEAVIGSAAYGKTQNYIERALAGETVNYEAELPYQQGGIRYVSASLVPDINQQVVSGYFVLITDISDLKQAEIALRNSRRFLEQIANASPNLIYLYDLTEQRNLYVNQEIRHSLGYSREEVTEMGEMLSTLMHPDDFTRYQDYFLQLAAARDGEVLEFEYRIRHKNGSWCWLISRDTVFARDAQGQVTQIVGSAQDITDRKRSEALIQAQVAREKLLREITQRIRSTLDLPNIFSTACEEIRRVLKCDRVGIFQFDPDSNYTQGEFVAEAVKANLPSVLNMPVEDHCFGEAYAERYRGGHYLVSNDIYQNGLSPCHAQILEVFGVKACMVMPLLQGDALWGLLCVHQCRQPRSWQSSEVDLVQQLSNQMAIAIQQAKFYERIQSELVVRERVERQIARQLREQRTLAAVTQITRESLDIAEILEIVARQVREVLEGDRVIIFRLYDDGRTRIVEESVGPDLPQLKHQHWDDEVWEAEVLERYWRAEPRIVPDVMQDQWTECLQEYSLAGQIRSKIVAPILQYETTNEINRWTHPQSLTKIWGLLVIHSCHEHREWQPEAARLLQQVADQLAIAVRQVSLFERLQEELQERQNAQSLLTERNQQLANSNQQLARATRMKDEFLANVSHEIRTPMNAIIGMTQLALETPLTAKQRNYLTKIDKSAAALLHIINDILDFSKIEAGKLTLEEVPFSLEEVLSNLSDVTTLQASSKGLELLFNVSIDTPLNLVGDSLRLGQILLNLVANAIKFTDKGHVVVSVSAIATSVDECKLRFAVTDTGIGLDQEQQSRLFQAFSQGDASTTRRFGGTGLGLAISKRLVQLMQGDIGVQSTLGEGSTFWFTATFKQPKSSTQALLATYRKTLDLREMRVLVVDDNAAARTLFHEMLTSFHFQPTVVETASEAIAAISAAEEQGNPYKLLIVDYIMPDVDGIALIQQIRRLMTPKAMPAILLVTAHRQFIVQETAQAADIYHLLYKPLKPSTLLNTIVDALQSGPEHRPLLAEVTLPQVGQNFTLADVRVLLVEDHEINQELAIELLTQAGAVVSVARNGQDAYNQVRREPFDVVLMDCQMPIMDGYEATRLIRTLPDVGQVPIIAMTANAMQGDRQKCLEIGMNDYIAKPIVKEDMYAAIRRWVPSADAAAHPSPMPVPAPTTPSATTPRNVFEHLDSFDTQSGLQYVGDNSALYTKLLCQFSTRYRDFDQQIRQAIRDDDYSEAVRLVHSLKGLSGTLGCEALQTKAQRLEDTLRDREAAFEKAELSSVIQALTTVLAEIEAWQQATTGQTASSPEQTQPEQTQVDWEALHTQVRLINDALETDWGAVLSALAQLQEMLPQTSQASDIVSLLTAHIEAFEIEQAQQELRALAQLAESQL